MPVKSARLPNPSLFAKGAIARLMFALGGDGEEIRIAGGAVRNAMLGLPANDIDCATTSLPKETIRRAERAGFHAIPTGIEHGTITVVVDGTPFEVTTLRADIATDGRRATVAFGRDFAADAARRDFTINALYADADGLVTDYVGGLDDIAAKRVRFIGDAATRIREDFLRILRLFRFHAIYGGGDLDADALSACIREREGLDILSRERVRAELMKLIAASRGAAMLRVMDETGFLVRILGGVVNRVRLSKLPIGAAPALKLGALAVECAEDAQRLRERLALSNQESDVLTRVARISEKLRAAEFNVAPKSMRALIYRDRADVAGAVIACLAAADAPPDMIADARTVAAWAPPSLPWRGADALAAGAKPGPQVGEWLARAESLWIEADFPGQADILADLWRRAAP